MTAPECADLFAGWGGFTEGAERAGASVVWAANHWQLAVDAHAANHPGTRHSCQDLNQANFYDVPDIDGLLAAPACQGHSTAAWSAAKRWDGKRKNGGQLHLRRSHDALRSTAWAVVSCADAKEPDWLIVENVPSFRRWRLFAAWRGALEALGYSLEEHLLTASHFGVPQRRKRLFVVGVRASSPLGLKFDRQPEPGFGPCVDWDAGSWRNIADIPAGPQRRIARARARGRGERFLIQNVTGHAGVSLDEPIRTITTGDQWAVVDGDRYRTLTVRENARAMGFADSYEVPATATRSDAIKGFGNAVAPPVGEALVSAVMAAA